jgi:hypothetical protein
MTKLPRITAVLVAVFAVVIAIPAFAGDPPSRVLRLKYMSGQVSFQPGGVDDWVAATINRPLTSADRVWTDKESRAELNMGTSSLRMDSETSLTLSNVSDNTVQVELDQGVLNIHVRRLYGGEIYEVDTPNVAFTLLKAGDYRFEVDAIADTTTVIVHKGKGEGNGNGRGVEVESGEMARFEHGNTMMHTMARAPRPDGFDDWCQVRNEREDKSYESARYVSDDVIGYEDLDDNGYWRTVPTYGTIWVPRTVVVGWAPYRYGHWAWIEPWGWTWVDDAPWGFAPFHYGRWVYSSYGWGWCPGPRHYRPIYSPALVAWFGGPHWGVGVSFGGGYGVGWVPLGWGEPYYPYYRVSRNYVREVNIRNTHITNINYVTNNYTTIINKGGNTTINNYVNVNHGATTVPGGVLEHGRPVAKSLVAVNDRDLREARFNAAPEVAPRRGGVLGGRGDSPAALPPSAALNRHVVTKMTPPDRPEKFESRQPYIERNHGMAVDKDTMSEMRKNPAPPMERGPRNNVTQPMAVTPGNPPTPANADRGKPMGNEAGRPAANVDNGKPANVDNARQDNGRPGNAMGRQVPRPPQNDRRVITLDGNGSDNAAKGNAGQPAAGVSDNNNGRTSRFVPRPPAERRPASGAEGTPAVSSPKQDVGADSGNRGVARPADSNRATAPEDRRSPVFDRNSNVSEKKVVEAEVNSPRNVPKPPEGSPVRSDPAAGTFNRRSTPDAVNDNRPSQPSNERRSAPDVSERRSAPQPSTERRESRPAPESRPTQESRPAREARPAPQKEERKSAPPVDKQKSEPAKTSSSLMNTETPRFAESSRFANVPKPPYAGQAARIRETSFAPRESSFSRPESGYAQRDTSSVSRISSWDRRENSTYSPRVSSSSSYSSPRQSYSGRSSYSSPRYERATSSPRYSAPSYSRSSSYSGGGSSRSYGGYSGARSSSHAASSSGGGRSSASSHGSSSSHASAHR